MYDLGIEEKERKIKNRKIVYVIVCLILTSIIVIMNYSKISDFYNIKLLEHQDLIVKIETVKSFHNFSGVGRLYYDINREETSCAANKKYNYNDAYYYKSDSSKCILGLNLFNKIKLIVWLTIDIILIFIFSISLNNKMSELKVLKILNTRGKLIKGLPYGDDGSSLSHRTLNGNYISKTRPVVKYTLPNGEERKFYGKYIEVKPKETLDLLIDEVNPNNYYIDYEIKKIGENNNE